MTWTPVVLRIEVPGWVVIEVRRLFSESRRMMIRIEVLGHVICAW
jgi:hypothetical protein